MPCGFRAAFFISIGRSQSQLYYACLGKIVYLQNLNY